jgi:hypothetical protein
MCTDVYLRTKAIKLLSKVRKYFRTKVVVRKYFRNYDSTLYESTSKVLSKVLSYESTMYESTFVRKYNVRKYNVRKYNVRKYFRTKVVVLSYLRS